MAEGGDTYAKLDYSIYKYSSYSTSYVPENIKVDNKNDQTSRWSSDSNFPPQFLILKLSKPAIVKNITFGKFEKTHVCNLKKFKIWGGVDEHTNIQLLEWGLKNNSTSETFDLKNTLGDKEFPCSYIKIEPIQSWGPSFNFSIWYVELRGIEDYTRVFNAAKWLEQYKEIEITKLCMKYFRQKNNLALCNMLTTSTGITLEHPLLTQLFNILVHEGDYDRAEHFMSDAVHNDYFKWYISQQDYEPVWENVTCDGPKPGMRGGHQMVLDPQTDTIYVLGGWDGTQDLSDFWSYNIEQNKWTLISQNVHYEGGPAPRSCHKMCLDPDRRQIFVLGRYLDQQLRQPENLKSDFYVYDMDNNSWTMISSDTASVGGPRLIFDHQMCFDPKTLKIYVFGGRVLTPSSGISDDRLPINTTNQSSSSSSSNNNNNAGQDYGLNRMDRHQHRINLLGQLLNENIDDDDNDDNNDVAAGAAADPNDNVINNNNEVDIRNFNSIADFVNNRVNNVIHNRVNNIIHNSVNNYENLSNLRESSSPSVARLTSSISSIINSHHVVNSSSTIGNSANTVFQNNSEQIFSGLYSYHIPTNLWECLIPTCSSNNKTNNTQSIISRAGHSMLCHPELRKLYIFAGQRNKEYLNDFITYNIDTQEVEHIQENIKSTKEESTAGLPASGFTRRATIDPEIGEIYVLSGLSKEKEKREETVQNSFWVYQIGKNHWSCVYKNENIGEQYWNKMQNVEPCPRFAHQLVYDPTNKAHYLFGGNPGKSCSPRLRLDDFWKLTLTRPDNNQILNHCKFLIRKCKFQELSLDKDNKMAALNYLQTNLSELINHEDKEQSREFRILAQHLFVESQDDHLTYLNMKQNKTSFCSDVNKIRSQLFDKLSQYFPQHMTQPKRNLEDLILF